MPLYFIVGSCFRKEDSDPRGQVAFDVPTAPSRKISSHPVALPGVPQSDDAVHGANIEDDAAETLKDEPDKNVKRKMVERMIETAPETESESENDDGIAR